MSKINKPLIILIGIIIALWLIFGPDSNPLPDPEIEAQIQRLELENEDLNEQIAVGRGRIQVLEDSLTIQEERDNIITQTIIVTNTRYEKKKDSIRTLPADGAVQFFADYLSRR